MSLPGKWEEGGAASEMSLSGKCVEGGAASEMSLPGKWEDGGAASEMSLSVKTEGGEAASECSPNRVKLERAESPVPNCLSMKSDSSVSHPVMFPGDVTCNPRNSTSAPWRAVILDMLDQPNERLRQERFSAQETDVLVREVQSRHAAIYGTKSKPPRLVEVRKAWNEVAVCVSTSSGLLRTAVQCRKRFNDVRRRGKQKLSVCRRDSAAAGGGPSAGQPLTPAEDLTSLQSVEGFGGIEVGFPAETCSSSQERAGQQRAGQQRASQQSAGQQRAGQGTEVPAEVEEEEERAEACPPLPQSGPRTTGTEGHRTRRQVLRDQPFLDLQRAGFDMLQRELVAIRRSVTALNTRLRRMDNRAHLLRRSVNRSLERLADAAERLSSPGPPQPPPVVQPTLETPLSSSDGLAQNPSARPPRRAAATANRLSTRLRTRGRRRIS